MTKHKTLAALGALLVALACVLLGRSLSGPAFGPLTGDYGGVTLLGCEKTGKNSKACEFQVDTQTIQPGVKATIWGLPVPSPVNGEILQLFVTLNEAALDGCSGALCNGGETRLLMCTWESGTCLDNWGDASDYLVRPFRPTVLADATAQIGADAGAGTITVSYVCPTGGQVCRVGGTISVNRITPGTPPTPPPTDSGGDSSDATPPPTDSGGDSSDASDAANDANDSGSPPTLTLITPNDCPASGTWGDGGSCVVTLSGTNFVNGGTTCTVNGVAMLSPNFAGAPTSGIATIPPFGGAGASTSGSGTLQIVNCSTSAGNNNGSGSPSALSKVHYLPSATANPSWETRSDYGVTGTAPVTVWSDYSSSGWNWAGTVDAGPTLTSAWNSTGRPAITTDGLVQYMTASAHLGATQNTLFVVGNFITLTGSPVALVAGQYFQANGAVFNFGSLTSSAQDTLPHVFMFYITGTTGSYMQVDTTAGATGSVGTGVVSELLGEYTGGSHFANFNTAEILSYPANLSPTEITNVIAGFKANWNTH